MSCFTKILLFCSWMLKQSYSLRDNGVLDVKLQMVSGSCFVMCVAPRDVCSDRGDRRHHTKYPPKPKSFLWLQPLPDTNEGARASLAFGLLLPDFRKPRAQRLSKLLTASRPRHLLATNKTSPPRISNSFPQIHSYFSHQKKRLFLVLFIKSGWPSLYIALLQIPLWET